MSEQPQDRILFDPGQVVATPEAIVAIEFAHASAIELLRRHLIGDWTEMEEDDRKANEAALQDGSRIFSAYTLADGTRIWVITEADRSSTCILLPSDY